MRVAKIDPRTADRQTGRAMKTAGDSYGKKTLLKRWKCWSRCRCRKGWI